MDIWYTPERIDLQQEIGERRMARYERRMARLRQQERQERVLSVASKVAGYLLGAVLIIASLFVGSLWAAM